MNSILVPYLALAQDTPPAGEPEIEDIAVEQPVYGAGGQKIGPLIAFFRRNREQGGGEMVPELRRIFILTPLSKLFSRRDLLQRATIAGLSVPAISALGLSHTALADPDNFQGTSTPTPSLIDPTIYPFKIGAWEAFVIQDGAFAMQGVQPTIAPEGTADEVSKILKANFLPTDRLSLSLNVLVIKREGQVILIDTGGGNVSGPTAGRLMMGLSRLGIKPEQVTSVILTHAHGDHIAGLLNPAGKPAFPKANVYIAKAEADFWLTPGTPDLSKSRIPEGGRAGMVSGARQFLNGVKSQLKTVPFAVEIIPGFEFVPVLGHTAGHSAVKITSGSESLLHIGDAVHQFAVQFARPEWSIMFDADPVLASASRRTLFSTAVKNETRIMAYHLPFPGIGHVRTLGEGFAWVPEPWGV